MSKRTNMGRGAHHAQDAELDQTEPGTEAIKPEQKTRPTQHPSQGTQDHKELP